MEFIQKLRHYLTSTESSPSALGRLALNDTRVVSEVMDRNRQINELAQEKLIITMKANPRGVGKKSDRYVVSDAKAEPVRVDRDPCFYCGNRRDLGCQHHPVLV